jgi:predicted ATPase
MPIKSVHIQNFKSIRDAEVELSQVNVLIGPNGGGKSNFISFFKFLNKLYEQQLQLYISQNGRADNFLYFGRKKSAFLKGKIVFNNDWQNQYEFKLVPELGGSLIFANESSTHSKDPSSRIHYGEDLNSSGSQETRLRLDSQLSSHSLRLELQSFKIYHFHDTSFNSKIKQPCTTTDYARLYEDGGNLAAFLYRLQESEPKTLGLIEKVITSIAPFFHRFYLQPDEINPQQIFLRWQEKGSDQMFTAHNFSDGTLRMICLATLLLQNNLPDTIIIDEPELGLHPFAIAKLAGMIKSASTHSQIIISTQSVTLLNHFSPDDVIVVERENEQSVFKRQNEQALSAWLEEYSLGELWDQNVIGGRP